MKVLEAPNSVMSRDKGDFSFNLPGKNEGDPFTIAGVQKPDYILVDKGVRGRKYGYSSKVPVEIVMVSRQQLERDKQHIEELSNERALRQYRQQMKELEQLRQEKRLTEEKYAANQRKLGEDFSRFTSLIDKMAETYALTDYENISDINYQIATAIENAELEKADSLIHSKGDYGRREEEARNLINTGRQAVAMAEKFFREGTEKINDLAQDYYYQHTIFLSNYQSDSAAYYLERRANLDPTNVGWLLSLANFLSEYLVDFERAERYARQALQVTVEKGEAEGTDAAYCLNDLAGIFNRAGKFDEALELYKRSADIRRKQFGDQSDELAKCYSNIGMTYRDKDMLDSARFYFEKALLIRQVAKDNECGSLASSYVDMGLIERREGHAHKALEYYYMALPLIRECGGEVSRPMVELCNSLGSANLDADSLDTAYEWYLKALDITRKLYGEDHPAVATVLDNIGGFLFDIRLYKKALEYHQQALNIREKWLGKHHPDVGHSYNNMGVCLYHLERAEEGYAYMQKALELDKLFFSERSSSVANDYNNMAVHLSRSGQTEQALESANKAIDIYTGIYGQQNVKVALVLANIADIYFEHKDYQLATEYYYKAIDMYKAVRGDHSSQLVRVYNNLSMLYNRQKDYQKQIDILWQAVEISRQVYGEESASMAKLYSNLAMAYLETKDFDNAKTYNRKAKAIKAKIHGADSYQAAVEDMMLANICEGTGEYDIAIQSLMDYLKIARPYKGEESQEVIVHLHMTYKLFGHLLGTAPTRQNQDWFQQFMADKSFVFSPDEGRLAANRGMKGDYTLLRYFDWTIDGDTTAYFQKTVDKARPLPNKRYVLMNPDGQIAVYEFDEPKVGVSFLLKYTDPEKKQQTVDSWRQWKLQHEEEK